MSVKFAFSPKEYREYGYKFFSTEKCIITLAMNNGVCGFVGRESGIKEVIDLLCESERLGLSPEDCGLSTKLAELEIAKMNN